MHDLLRFEHSADAGGGGGGGGGIYSYSYSTSPKKSPHLGVPITELSTRTVLIRNI